MLINAFDDEVDITAVLQKARQGTDDRTYRQTYRKIDFINFSPKQRAALNCLASALYLKTGNQFGKTTAATGMVVFQTTQEFPQWFTGWRQPKLNLSRPHSMVVWCLAPNWQMARDGIASKILGDYASGQIGQGLMPAENIVSIQAARGIAGAVDSVVIRRKDGTTAVIRFKTYEQGREALQSESVDLIIADEMPTDMGLWNELLARLSATSGVIWLTATPRRQQSLIAQWYKEPAHPERQTITATLDDAEHLTDEQRAAMKARYANNPLEARTRLYGEDYAGGGLVFDVPMSEIAYLRDPADFPEWFKWIIGFDPGHGGQSEQAHPAAAVECCWDPNSSALYVVDCLRLDRPLPETLAASILQWECGDAPVAWGHGENQGVAGTNETYAAMYRRLGLRMLREHAQFEGGGYSLEVGLSLMRQMMADGKLKVAKHLDDWWEEFHSYERDEKTGKPIPIRDDLMAATRYAVMMAPRHAKTLLGERSADGGRALDIWRRQNESGKQALGVNFDPWNPQLD